MKMSFACALCHAAAWTTVLKKMNMKFCPAAAWSNIIIL